MARAKSLRAQAASFLETAKAIAGTLLETADRIHPEGKDTSMGIVADKINGLLAKLKDFGTKLTDSGATIVKLSTDLGTANTQVVALQAQMADASAQLVAFQAAAKNGTLDDADLVAVAAADAELK